MKDYKGISEVLLELKICTSQRGICYDQKETKHGIELLCARQLMKKGWGVGFPVSNRSLSRNTGQTHCSSSRWQFYHSVCLGKYIKQGSVRRMLPAMQDKATFGLSQWQRADTEYFLNKRIITPHLHARLKWPCLEVEGRGIRAKKSSLHGVQGVQSHTEGMSVDVVRWLTASWKDRDKRRYLRRPLLLGARLKRKADNWKVLGGLVNTLVEICY